MLSVAGKLERTRIMILKVVVGCLPSAQPNGDSQQTRNQGLPNGSSILRVVGKDGTSSSKRFGMQ